MGIVRRIGKLEQAARQIPMHSDEPMVKVEPPDEWWAAAFQDLFTVPVSYMAQVEKIYGDEARLRGESPLVTYLRTAADPVAAMKERA